MPFLFFNGSPGNIRQFILKYTYNLEIHSLYDINLRKTQVIVYIEVILATENNLNLDNWAIPLWVFIFVSIVMKSEAIYGKETNDNRRGSTTVKQ